MITLKLWQLAALALPLIILLAGQTLLIFLFTYFVIFNIMAATMTLRSLQRASAALAWAQPPTPWPICRPCAKNMHLQLRHTC